LGEAVEGWRLNQSTKCAGSAEAYVVEKNPHDISTTVVDRRPVAGNLVCDSGSVARGIGVFSASLTNAADVQCRAILATTLG
jgi:hypothetical protein